MKKRSERCKHCVLAVARRSQKILPRHRHLPGDAGWSKFNHFFCWGSMHAISSYSGNRPTNTHKQTNWQTGPITIHCAAKLSVQCCHQPKNGSLADSEGKLCRVLLVMMVVLPVMLVVMPNLSMLYTVVPDHNADDDGLRRSKRVRVRPLEWYRCERIAYQWDNSGMIYYRGILLCLDLNPSMHSLWRVAGTLG